MRFLFFSKDPQKLYKGILEERAVGGGPASVIRLGDALAKLGHEIFIVSEKEDLMDNPKYIGKSSLSELKEVDIALAVKGWQELLALPLRFKKAFYWTGESHLNPNTFGLSDKRLSYKIDAFLPKSQWQQEQFAQVAEFPREKMWVLPNGVYLDNFKNPPTKIPKRLIYASTPVRGLSHLVSYFPLLKKKHPDLKLYIYSSFDRYDQENEDFSYETVFQTLRDMEGCYLQKSITQKELAYEFMLSTILIYPTSFQETCSNITLEAQAAGCIPVTTHLASLPETVGDGGILIPGLPGNETYDKLFLKAVDCLLSDDNLCNKLQKRGVDRMRECGWEERARTFLHYLQEKHGLS